MKRIDERVRQVVVAGALVLLAAPFGAAQIFERDVTRGLETLAEEREAADRAKEAIRLSCQKVVDREKGVFRALEAAELSAASRRQGPLLEAVIGLRRSLSEKDLVELKRANIERRRLLLAGVRPSPEGQGGLLAHWEGKMTAVLSPRYEAYAPGHKSFDCPAGSRRSEDGAPASERNVLLPPPGACWAQDGEKPVAAVSSIIWFFGTPDDALGEATVYAAACAGPIAWAWSDYRRETVARLVHPTCVVLDLLDGSLPPGAAPEKYVRGPAVRAVDADPKGGTMTLLPEQTEYVQGRLYSAKLPECVEHRP